MSDPLPPDLSADRPDDHEFEDDSLAKDQSAFFPCLRCRQRRPLEKHYRICAACMAHCRGNPKDAKMWLWGPREQPDPAPAPPGSEAKLALLRKRLEDGEELFGLDDPAIDPDTSALLALLHRPLTRAAGMTGIERDGDTFRVRPMHRGKKHDLGTFRQDEEAKAVAVCRAFWLEVLELPEDASQDHIEEARKAAADTSREQSRERLARERRNRPTGLFD